MNRERLIKIIIETESTSNTRDWDREGSLIAMQIKKLRDNNLKRIGELADAILKVIEEDRYCGCKEKPVRLMSYCRNCGKKIKDPPTIEEMLNEESIQPKPQPDAEIKELNKWRPNKVLTLDNIAQHKLWVEQELEALEEKWDKKLIPLEHFGAETHYVLRMLLDAIELVRWVNG